MPDIAVAIVTYKRPELLSTAVDAVLSQIGALPGNGVLIVVDNDPDQSARSVVPQVRSPLIRYVAEPKVGIAATQNAALDAAANFGAIVFIDDDEVPEPGWLAALVTAWAAWRCDAVAGPTIRSLDGSEDRWVKASGFFDDPSRPDGTLIDGASTSNLLLDMATVGRLGLRFDQRFGVTGGSDSLFTRQLTARNGSIRWCERAVTSEPVPPNRTTRRWVLAREQRTGNAWSRVHLVMADGGFKHLTARLYLVAVAAKVGASGAVSYVAGLASKDLGRRSRGERLLVRASGVLLATIGTQVAEYSRDSNP